MFYIMLMTIEDEGERLRIEVIYEENYLKCLYLAQKITGNQHLAEEAVSETFLKVIEGKDKILSKKRCELPAFLAIITKHKALDIIKKQNRIFDTSIDDLEETLESDETLIDERVISKLGFERLCEHISNLNENYKVVFEMKYIHGMLNNVIAEELGITQKNVEMRLHRAKMKLRKSLESEVKHNV